MSGPMPLTWAELDQLADWTAGLLTGPDADHITHLIATDPRWRKAHTALTHAQPALHTALHTAATAINPGPIPPDIAARITHTLTHTHPATTHHRSAGRARHGSRPPGRPQRTRRRSALVTAALALVLLGGVGGLSALLHFGAGGSTADSAAPPADAEATDGLAMPTPLAPNGGGDAPTLFASGTDYRAETLGLVAQLAPSSRVDLHAPQFAADQPYEGVATIEGFDACVDAVLETHPGRVLLADFAQYEGSPAVILRIVQQSGSVAVAVGPQCGRDGDPHELASAALP